MQPTPARRPPAYDERTAVPASVVSVPSTTSLFPQISGMTMEYFKTAYENVRTLVFERSNEGYGVILSGNAPVYIENILPTSTVKAAGGLTGDIIVGLKALHVEHASQKDVVSILKNAHGKVEMIVGRKHARRTSVHDPSVVIPAPKRSPGHPPTLTRTPSSPRSPHTPMATPQPRRSSAESQGAPSSARASNAGLLQAPTTTNPKSLSRRRSLSVPALNTPEAPLRPPRLFYDPRRPLSRFSGAYSESCIPSAVALAQSPPQARNPQATPIVSLSTPSARPLLSAPGSALRFELHPKEPVTPAPRGHVDGHEWAAAQIAALQLKQITRLPATTGAVGLSKASSQSHALAAFRRLSLAQSAQSDPGHKTVSLPALARELAAILAVKHTNLLPFIGLGAFGTGGGDLVLAFDAPHALLMDCLTERHADCLPRTQAQVLELCQGLAHGVAYLHGSQLVHGYLSPHSIVLANRVPRIGFFGLAHLFCAVSDQLDPDIGRYLSPEALLGSLPEYPADVYSLCSIYYLLLSGKRPFASLTTLGDLVDEVVIEGNRPPLTMRYAHDLLPLLTTCWSKQPKQRPDAVAVASGITAALGNMRDPDGSPVTAVELSPASPAEELTPVATVQGPSKIPRPPSSASNGPLAAPPPYAPPPFPSPDTIRRSRIRIHQELRGSPLQTQPALQLQGRRSSASVSATVSPTSLPSFEPARPVSVERPASFNPTRGFDGLSPPRKADSLSSDNIPRRSSEHGPDRSRTAADSYIPRASSERHRSLPRVSPSLVQTPPTYSSPTHFEQPQSPTRSPPSGPIQIIAPDVSRSAATSIASESPEKSPSSTAGSTVSAPPALGSGSAQTTPAAPAAAATAAGAVDGEEGDDFFEMLTKAKRESRAVATEERPDFTDLHPGITGPAKWALKFEYLLSAPAGVDAFRSYLRTTFCEENLAFWEATERLRTMAPAQVSAAAKDIYDIYLGPRAGQSLNVESATRAEADQFVAKGEIGLEMLLPAQQEVFRLMKLDSYPRFIKSGLYQDHLLNEPKTRTDAKPRQEARVHPGSKRNSAPSVAAVAETPKRQSEAQTLRSSLSILFRKRAVTEAVTPIGRITPGGSSVADESILDSDGKKKRSTWHKLVPWGSKHKRASADVEAPDTVHRPRGASGLREDGSVRAGAASEPRPDSPTSAVSSAESSARSSRVSASELLPARPSVVVAEHIKINITLPNMNRHSLEVQSGQTLESALRALAARYNLSMQYHSICRLGCSTPLPGDALVDTVHGQELYMRLSQLLTVSYPDGRRCQVPITGDTLRQSLQSGYVKRSLNFVDHPPYVVGRNGFQMLDPSQPAVRFVGLDIRVGLQPLKAASPGPSPVPPTIPETNLDDASFV
eukprot:m.128089 g.128089  ORF g.128089 m.128089 type:complete len:1374 (-) comp9405_c0_seq2:323-4444(-)